jgi:hypothetical protein
MGKKNNLPQIFINGDTNNVEINVPSKMSNKELVKKYNEQTRKLKDFPQTADNFRDILFLELVNGKILEGGKEIDRKNVYFRITANDNELAGMEMFEKIKDMFGGLF